MTYKDYVLSKQPQDLHEMNVWLMAEHSKILLRNE